MIFSAQDEEGFAENITEKNDKNSDFALLDIGLSVEFGDGGSENTMRFEKRHKERTYQVIKRKMLRYKAH